MEFLLIIGNAGTGCTGEAQVEHGCDFVPVAGRKSLYTGILSALTEEKACLLQLLGKCPFPSLTKPNHIDTNRFAS